MAGVPDGSNTATLDMMAMSNTMSNMKTATIREVQHGLSAVIKRVQRGEEVTITRRGQVIARLVPAGVAKKQKAKWPDFTGRMRAIFPEGVPPGKPTSEVVKELREERF